jgi:hypothetical protein
VSDRIQLFSGSDLPIDAQRRDESLCQQHAVEREGLPRRNARVQTTTDRDQRSNRSDSSTAAGRRKAFQFPVPLPKLIAEEHPTGPSTLPILQRNHRPYRSSARSVCSDGSGRTAQLSGAARIGRPEPVDPLVEVTVLRLSSGLIKREPGAVAALIQQYSTTQHY